MQDPTGGLALVYHHLIWVMLFVSMHLIIAKFEIDCSRQQGNVFKAVCPMLLQHTVVAACCFDQGMCSIMFTSGFEEFLQLYRRQKHG